MAERQNLIEVLGSDRRIATDMRVGSVNSESREIIKDTNLIVFKAIQNNQIEV
jgi:hypothetical protein